MQQTPPGFPTPPHASVSRPRRPSPLSDGLLQASAILAVLTLLGAFVVGRIVGNLAPDDVPATGMQTPTAHVVPVFGSVPSRVETGGVPLTVTLRATGTRIEDGHRISRFVFAARPPNDEPTVLCDSPTEGTCALRLDGSRRQSGTWILTLTTYDDTGAAASVETRMRVI